VDEQLSAKRYEPPTIDLENAKNVYKISLDLIGEHKKILEIGSSTGYISEILKKYGNQVTGIEIDQEAGQIAKKNCDQLIIGDVELLDLDQYLENASFDVILCGDVLEHLKAPATLLKRVKKYLKPDGYLVVSLPNFCHGDVLLNILLGDFHYTSKGLLDETHLHFFGLKNIYTLFAECGYTIQNIHTTNLDIGNTELKVDADKIPETLLKFVRSLPNSDVYQFVFTAHPSAGVTIPEFTEPDIKKLVVDSFEEQIQEFRSELSQVIEKKQAVEIEILRLREVLPLKDNHIKNLDAIIHTKDTQIQKIETELAQLHDDYSDNIKELEQLKKEIDEKERHIVKIEELLRISQRGVLEKISDKCFFTLRKNSPVGTKRRKLVELLYHAVAIYSTEGLLSLTFQIKSKLENTILLRHTHSTTPIIATDINHLPGNVPFLLEQELSGLFTCPIDGLDEIRFFSATYCRKNAGLIFQLRDHETGHVVRSARIKFYEIRNNNWTRVSFFPIQDSKGKTFQFSITSLGSPAAAIWFNPQQTFSQLQLLDENGPITGSIGFQCFSTLRDHDLYDLWIFNHEPAQKQLEQLKMENQKFSYQPKISIITPVWNVDEKWLRLAIESVINQVYPHWELCLADGGSTKPHIRQVLNEYAAKDSRIKVKFLGENKGIAGNSNEALALVTGEFVGFLDHDDELAPFALYEVVKLLNQNQNLQFVYSDEDKIDERGNRKNAYFKPDWSPDMFLSHNYLCHFSVIRKTLIDSAGGFRPGYDGSQDYDLFLRVTERIPANEIAHISKILYHWRMIGGSAASQLSAKPYAFVSAKKALTDALARKEIRGEVGDGLFQGSYRVQYAIKDNPKISIIIPTKDNVEILQRCIQSILEKTAYHNFEIVIVDNQSRNRETFDFYQSLKDNPKIRLLDYDKPFNFSAINNFAVDQIDSPYILFLNNDTEVFSREWLSAMLEHAQREKIGAVGAKLLYPDNTIQHAGIVLGIIGNPPLGGHAHRHLPDGHHGYFGRVDTIQDVSAVTAACLLMKKEVFEQIGGFDEKLQIAFNDVDLCLKIRDSGYLLVYTPYAILLHHESLSRGYEDTPEKQKRFAGEVNYVREKWGDIIDDGDPYYNRNLTRDKEDFSIQVKNIQG